MSENTENITANNKEGSRCAVMSNRFSTAVTRAVAQKSENWEFEYYRGTDVDDEYNKRRLNVYLETRSSALGPEWSELNTCVLQMRRELPRCVV